MSEPTATEIERVARAISVTTSDFKGRGYGNGDYMTPDDEWVNKHWPRWAEMARAAIMALRSAD